MKIRTFVSIATVIIVLWNAAFSSAASVNVTPSGGNSFIIQGDGMDGVYGVDVVINYDSSSLSAPTVSQGALVSGALFVTNTNSPGVIKVGVISVKAFSGSGQIGLITFAEKKGSGGITSVSSKTIDSSGDLTSAQTDASGGGDSSTVFSSTPGIPFSRPTTASTPATTSTSAASTSQTTGSSTTLSGYVVMPSEVTPKKETSPAETTAKVVEAPAEELEIAVTSAKADIPAAAKDIEPPAKPEKSKSTVYSGVLERFRNYKGEKNPAILSALFKKEVASSIRQQSLVVLSDGTTNLRVVATLTSSAGASPNFALNGATLVSLKRDSNSANWIIDVLPRKNAVQATLTIMDGSEDIEYPLTTAPPLKDRLVSEAAFAAFLKNTDIKVTDLNGDGKHDYIDDYIYTANYLARMGEEKAKKEASAK
jgi:hypothetical protein